MESSSREEAWLVRELLHLPQRQENRFDHASDCRLRQILFQSLARQREDYLRLFFPHGPPTDQSESWSLRAAQGAEDGAEYAATAKGTACGHIFKSGESTYHCKTCAADDTCVLCARCYDASDHEGHTVFISVSPGNSGCCDCGDREAWKRDVSCTIHSADAIPSQQRSGKRKEPVGMIGADLPVDLVEAIRMTIARVADYLCDVFSCAPEQLRLPKTVSSVSNDEKASRLSNAYGEDTACTEYALVLWNDEKHTVHEVQNQVARACQQRKSFGYAKAMEVNDIGRSIVEYNTDLPGLIRKAEIIEQIKVTATIRSSRDTFREQMCETIIDWISDISGCSVGTNSQILRTIVCEELLKPWRTGGQIGTRDVGSDGLYDHEIEDNRKQQRELRSLFAPLAPGLAVLRANAGRRAGRDDDNDDDDDDEEDDFDDEDDDIEIEDDDEDLMDMETDEMEIDLRNAANVAMATSAADADMDVDYLEGNDDVTEAFEATLAGYPPPPPPPAHSHRRRIFTPADSDDGEAETNRPAANEPYSPVPRTPRIRSNVKRSLKPSKYWLEKPDGYRATQSTEPCEDLWQRVRLDFLILYDLRLWKTLRINLRHLYITTVVTIPHFKRILGLRFAGLYTALAQLYLIADREPDHSIINLSVQMLTTPTITQEVVERGNFLTNLMAILYTFLTTRQVGFPEDISPKATLAFDAGAVTNRRMFHFFLDLRWLFQSEFIHNRMRIEQRYLLQFLDLVKLHQGVCPNVRATGDHVEYESDAWIGASMIVKEINKLCKQIVVSFEPKPETGDGDSHLQRAIRTVAQTVLINSYGQERKRFHAAEVKEEQHFHDVGPFEDSGKRYRVPVHVVQSEPMSFHHPLHYLLSWLIENAKGMSRGEMRVLLHFSSDDLKDPWNVSRSQNLHADVAYDDLLSAIFEHPLRVCVWLAQMKAGMWVRNGITLRHQAHTYRSVSHRDVGYQRDILMVQAGLVLSGSNSDRPGERFLAQMIDRFQITTWCKGDYSIMPGFEESQQLDVIEDFIHLLVIALCERGNLVPNSDSKEQHDKVLQHDIAHSLCFKPLSFSDLASRVTEKVGESDDFNRVLESMTTFRAPEGLNDTGTFELKPEYIELVDPYYAHYSRNHREEAENIYKKHVARKTGKKVDDVVYEPNLQPIPSGMFMNLAAFTATPLFVQIIANALNFAARVRQKETKLQVTRIETFLHVVLHLAMIATMEDNDQVDGFVKHAATPQNFMTSSDQRSVVSLLVTLSGMDEYASCHPTIKNILRKMHFRLPEKVNTVIGPLGAILDRADTGSPASISSEDKERKKQEALARQAKVMAQMKQQQNSFMQNQGLTGFEDEFDDLDDMSITEEPENVEHKKTWSFPSGTCIWCQEETDDQRLYGTFVFLGESNILRSTPVDSWDFIREVVDTPRSLDRPADSIRPFGVAGQNKQIIAKVGPDGQPIQFERQGLSMGFPHQQHIIKAPVATGCGHIMHYSCFDLYLQNSQRRHQQQIARNHPEATDLKEFTCPLCKALGNAFLPIIWKAKECAQEHELHAAKNFGDWLREDAFSKFAMHLTAVPGDLTVQHRQLQAEEFSDRSKQYVHNMFASSLIANMNDLSLDSPTSPQQADSPYPRLRRGWSISRMLSLNRSEGTQTPGGGPSFSPQPEQPTRANELKKAYHGIDETIHLNRLTPVTQTRDGSENPAWALSRALGLSISAFEIAQRGVGTDVHATSLLLDLPEQHLTHFRVFSETIESYLAVNILRSSSKNPVVQEIVKKREAMIAQLYGGRLRDTSSSMLDSPTQDILLLDDSFLCFIDWLSFMAPSVAEASNVLQLFYWAEIVKTLMVYTKVMSDTKASFTMQRFVPEGQVSQEFKLTVNTIVDQADDDAVEFTEGQCSPLRHLVEKYASAFLRKCMVAMYVRYGLDFECPYNVDPEAPELQRLTALLHISPLEDLFELYTARSENGGKMRQVTGRWISLSKMVTKGDAGPTVSVPHPAIFELVGLPRTYDTLTEMAIRRKCPTTGKEISDPAVCLFCGAIFCSQAVCCMKDQNKGGCFQHMEKCGGNVGVFINIRKCMVIFMHGPGNGSFAPAPYLDKHGETDPTLRRHHQLFLNQRRYDKLIRDAWLQHSIPTVISRKLESDVNPGGWETL